jgi:hypothetical protein
MPTNYNELVPIAPEDAGLLVQCYFQAPSGAETASEQEKARAC